ncbi:MAG: hypothetical protein ACPGR8_05245 [Limisphaerales bacterium]
MNMDGQDEQDFGVHSATTVQNALGQALGLGLAKRLCGVVGLA